MAFKLAEAFVELTLHDSALVAGLARVNRAVDETQQRLSSLDDLTGAITRAPAFSPDDVASSLSGFVESRGRQAPENVVGPADAVAPRRSQASTSASVQDDLSRPFAALADPLRDLSSTLERFASDEDFSAASRTPSRSETALNSENNRFAIASALLDELSRAATVREPPDRTDRLSQQQLDALLRLDENVSRILQIQESRQAAGTALFSPPA